MLTSAFQPSSPARLPRTKDQVPEFHRPRDSPPQRIILVPPPPHCLFCFLFFQDISTTFSSTSSFEHRKPLSGRTQERTLQVQTLLIQFATHSTHSCPKTTSEGQHLLPGFLQHYQSRGPDCQHLLIRTGHLWQKFVDSEEIPKIQTGKERPVLDPFPNRHT